MNTKKERIDFIIKKKGLSYNQLSKLIGSIISGDGLRKAIVRSSKKDEYYLELIAKHTGFNLEWILNGEGNARANEKSEITTKTNDTKTNTLNVAYLEKDGVKIHIDEMVDFMEEKYDELLLESNKYRFFMSDKTNIRMYQFFKEHGIQVKVNNDPLTK